MIHRDVSPSNIMLSYEGAVKMLDFGIAKALGEAPETTKSGTMKGKYAYMAPEQTEGDDVDNRIDIFSCGIVLHEVLTGRRLFKGANDMQTIERVRRCEVPPPSLQNPMVPARARRHRAQARSRATATIGGRPRAEMADALDDVVHASRFQPAHLAQLLHDLFPLEGGGALPAPAASASSQATHYDQPLERHRLGHPVGGPLGPTIRPITRSSSRGAPVDAPAAAERLSPSAREVERSPARSPCSAWADSSSGRGRPRTSVNDPAVHAPVPNDPSRRFNIYVKSDPPGADIFLDGKAKPIGATPITLPIDLNGVSSVQMVLKKPGYEDYQQFVINDDRRSRSTSGAGRARRGTKPAGEADPRRAAAAAEPEEAAPSEEAATRRPRPSATARQRLDRRRRPPRATIVDPFQQTRSKSRRSRRRGRSRGRG